MNYSNYHWIGDFTKSEMFDLRNEEEDVAIGIYKLIDFPEVILHIDIENDKVLEVLLEELEWGIHISM